MDDLKWTDGVHGNGLHGCREVAENRDWCSEHGWEDASGKAYAFEARLASPAACGTCAPPLGSTKLAVPAAFPLTMNNLLLFTAVLSCIFLAEHSK